jgi:hypothetical protein
VAALWVLSGPSIVRHVNDTGSEIRLTCDGPFAPLPTLLVAGN